MFFAAVGYTLAAPWTLAPVKFVTHGCGATRTSSSALTKPLRKLRTYLGGISTGGKALEKNDEIIQEIARSC